MFQTTARNKFDFDVIVNGWIIRRFDPIIITSVNSLFPFLQINEQMFKKIELYYADDKMNVNTRLCEGPNAILAQQAIS